jgi:phosphate transport system substrate-binding protein
MSLNNVTKTLAIAFAATLALGACSKKRKEGENSGKATSGKSNTGKAVGGGIIKIDGSSTVFPITQAVSEEFGRKHKARVMVGVSGTGGGFKKFCRGETVISGASRPIKASERKACKDAGIEYMELPVAYDGIAVVVHKSNDWVDHLTVAELKAMWSPDAKGKVTNWNKVRTGFPDKRLTLFGPGVDSGTYDYFTKAIVGKEHASRGDFTSSEDDNVLVKGVATDKGALGFFGYAYYAENKDKLKLVPVDNGKDDDGKGPIAPSMETVANGTYQPLARPIFIYVAVKGADRPEVKAFVDFYLNEGRKLVKEVGYIPLPDKAYELVKKRFAKRVKGSLFEGGSKVGVTIEELLSKEGA